MSKTISKKIAILALCLIVAVVSLIGASAFMAHAADSDKIISDFAAGEVSQWNKNDLSETTEDGMFLLSGGEISTNETMSDFLAVIEIGSVMQGFQFSFGAAGADAFTIKFDGAILRTINLKTQQGATAVTMLDMLNAKSIIEVRVVSGNIKVSIKKPNEPFETLEKSVANFVYDGSKTTTSGNIRISAFDGSSVTVSAVKLYSLNSSINIEAENFVPHEKPQPTKDGLSTVAIVLMSTLIPLGVILLVGGVVVLVLFLRRKNKNEKSN